MFSVFDPQSSFMIPNWVQVICVFGLVPRSMFVGSSRMSEVESASKEFMSAEVEALSSGTKIPSLSKFSMSIFSLILMVNLLGLLPYVFTATSHLSISASLGVPVLFMCYFKSAVWDSKSVSSLVSSIVPAGTPGGLVPFMFLIELLSSWIRPITISVRLCANITAGHLILGLAGEVVMFPWAFTLAPIMALTLLEVGVGVIQAYVFSMLSTLYVLDTKGHYDLKKFLSEFAIQRNQYWLFVKEAVTA